MEKLSIFLIACILTLSLLLCSDAFTIPGAVSAPAWYTYPKVRQVPWGKNMERIVYQRPTEVTTTTRDVNVVPSESTSELVTEIPAIETGVGEPIEGGVKDQKPCNCAMCAGRRQKQFVKIPLKPRFLFGSPYGMGYEYQHDDYYDDYSYGGYPGGYGVYPGYGGGFGYGDYGYGGGYPYGGGMMGGMGGGYW